MLDTDSINGELSIAYVFLGIALGLSIFPIACQLLKALVYKALGAPKLIYLFSYPTMSLKVMAERFVLNSLEFKWVCLFPAYFLSTLSLALGIFCAAEWCFALLFGALVHQLYGLSYLGISNCMSEKGKRFYYEDPVKRSGHVFEKKDSVA